MMLPYYLRVSHVALYIRDSHTKRYSVRIYPKTVNGSSDIRANCSLRLSFIIDPDRDRTQETVAQSLHRAFISLVLGCDLSCFPYSSNSSLTPDSTTVALPAGEALQRKKRKRKAISNRSCFVASHSNLDQSSSRNAKASINKLSVYRTITQSKTKTTKTKATPLGACEVIATSLWSNHDTFDAKTRT